MIGCLSIDRASPAIPADSPAGGVGIRGCGGDQVVVHITVEACLLGWALLLHLNGISSDELLDR